MGAMGVHYINGALARIIRETSSGGVLAEGFGGDQALAAGSDGGICITGEIERLW
jgi:hypothetical protein